MLVKKFGTAISDEMLEKKVNIERLIESIFLQDFGITIYKYSSTLYKSNNINASFNFLTVIDGDNLYKFDNIIKLISFNKTWEFYPHNNAFKFSFQICDIDGFITELSTYIDSKKYNL